MHIVRDQLMASSLLTDVLSRVRFEYRLLLDEHNAALVLRAATACQQCEHVFSCRRWIELHEDGAANPPPPFCPAIVGLAQVSARGAGY